MEKLTNSLSGTLSYMYKHSWRVKVEIILIFLIRYFLKLDNFNFFCVEFNSFKIFLFT